MRASLDEHAPVMRGLGPVFGPAKSAFDQDIERGQREAKTSVGDYVRAAFRQDSPIDGAIGWAVGTQFTPEPDYNPYDEKFLAPLKEGIAPEFHNELYKANSKNQAIYIATRLAQKQDDLQKLGDLGAAGNVGRIALGFVDPANFALGVVSGGLGSLVRPASALGTFAAGVGGAALGGYAFERARQSVNFEDSQAQAVVASLMGTAFAAPFLGIGARQMARVRAAAMRELEHARDVQHAQATGEVPPGAEARAEEIAAAAEHNEPSPLPEVVEPPSPEALVPHVEVEAPAVEAPAAPNPQQAVAGIGTGITDGLYSGLFKSLTEGKDTFGGIKDPVLERARPAFERGEIKSPEDLRAFVNTPEAPAAATKEIAAKEAVSWSNDDGDEFFGTVVKDLGSHLMVETEGGRKVKVAKDRITFDTSETPEGFVQGSVGAGATEKIAGVHEEAFGNDLIEKARIDISHDLGTDANAEVRALGADLVYNPINRSEHYAQQRTATEEKKLLQRVHGNNFHFESAQAWEAAVKKLGYGTFARSKEANVRAFFESAGRLARGEEGVLALGNNAKIEPELRRVASAYRKVMEAMKDEMVKSGVKGAEHLVENPAFVNRIWNVPKIKEAMKKHSRADVFRLLSEAALREAHGDVAVAENFLKAVTRLEHSHLSTDLLLHATDAPTLERELARAKLSFDEIEAIKKTLFFEEPREGKAADAGNPPNLKYRFSIDETYSIQTEKGPLAIADLLENDARVLMDRYLNSMAGHVALAKKGIKSRADFDARLRAADKDHEANELERSGEQYAAVKQKLNDVYANITGRPMSVHSFNKFDRFANLLRTLARSAYLGQLGVSAGNELWHAASISTFNAASAHMPSFAEFVRAARKGFVPGDKLAEDVRTIWAFGTEHTASYARQHELTDFTYDRQLSSFENKANTMSHVIDRLSGNNFLTSYSRGLAAKFMVQKYANMATGKLAIDRAWTRRLVQAGIDSDEIGNVLSHLKKYTERDANGHVQTIRYEDWSAAHPETYGSFTTAIQREVRSAIQDHDLGETWYLQHTSIGKIFTELRAFSIAAHSKQFLSSLHYRDHRALHLWITGFVTQSLAYVLQTSLNYAHDPEKRAKMLTVDKISFGAYKRMSVGGLTSLITEPFLPPQLSGLTANTENRVPWFTPSMLMAGKALGGVSALAQSGLYGENFTGHDVKNLLGALPGNNLYGARNIVDMISSMAPKSELRPTP